MSKAVETLIDILDLERIEHNLYRGESPDVGWQRIFGGQVIGQALVAAQRTVQSGKDEPERIVHSLHGYFMRPGDPSVPTIYEVDRIRDGRSFTTRRVVAIQHGRAIFSMSASFQITGKLPNDTAVQQAVLAYASDMTLLDTSLFAHGRAVFDPNLQVASLDHAMWFHRPMNMEEWHLYSQDSPNSSGARGFTRGSIYSRDGQLVASVAQEGLIRERKKDFGKTKVAGG